MLTWLNRHKRSSRASTKQLSAEIAVLTKHVKNFTDKVEQGPVLLLADGKKIAEIVERQDRRRRQAK